MSSSVTFLVVTHDTQSAQILQKKDERTVIYTPRYYHPKKRNNTKKIEHNTTFLETEVQSRCWLLPTKIYLKHLL